MNDKLRAAHDKLQDAVAEIVSGDEWKRMLKVALQFHRYSFKNPATRFGTVRSCRVPRRSRRSRSSPSPTSLSRAQASG